MLIKCYSPLLFLLAKMFPSWRMTNLQDLFVRYSIFHGLSSPTLFFNSIFHSIVNSGVHPINLVKGFSLLLVWQMYLFFVSKLWVNYYFFFFPNVLNNVCIYTFFFFPKNYLNSLLFCKTNFCTGCFYLWRSKNLIIWFLFKNYHKLLKSTVGNQLTNLLGSCFVQQLVTHINSQLKSNAVIWLMQILFNWPPVMKKCSSNHLFKKKKKTQI